MLGKRQDHLSVLPASQEHVLANPDGKPRLLCALSDISRAFVLARPHKEMSLIRDDVGFLQAVRSVLTKNTPVEQKTDDELDHAIRQIISKAVASDDVVDIFEAARLKKPDL